MRIRLLFIFSIISFTMVSASNGDSISPYEKFKTKNKFGISLQTNLTTVKPNYKATFENADGFRYKVQPKLGFGLGVNYQFKINKKLAIDIQIVTIRKRGQLEIQGDSFTNYYKFYNYSSKVNLLTLSSKFGLEYSKNITPKFKILICPSIEIPMGGIIVRGSNQSGKGIAIPDYIESGGRRVYKNPSRGEKILLIFSPRIGIETKLIKNKKLSTYLGYSQIRNNANKSMVMESYYENSFSGKTRYFNVPLIISDIFFQIIYKF